MVYNYFCINNKFALLKQVILRAIIFVLIIMSFSNAFVSADDNEKNGTIKIGLIWDSISEIAEDNVIDGISKYSKAYFSEIALHTNWEYEYVNVSFEEGIDMLKKGEIQFIGPVKKTEKREQELAYSDSEFGQSYSVMLTKKDNEELWYDDFELFNGIRVGMIDNEITKTSFSKLCEDNQIKTVNTYYDNHNDMLNAFDKGELDAFISESIFDRGKEKTITRFGMEPYYFASSKDDIKLIETMNTALEKIKYSDTNFNAKLYNKYLKDTVKTGGISFTRQENEYIKAHPVLNIAGNPDWEPMEYYDLKSGEMKGINPEIIKKISDYCNIDFNYIKTDNFQKSIELISEGKADLLSGDANTVSADIVDTTDAYTSPGTAIVGKSSLLKSEYTLAIPENYNNPQMLLNLPQGATPLVFADINECLKAVRDGKADCTAINIYTLDLIMKSEKYGSLEIVSILNLNTDMVLGVKKGSDPCLLSILNKAIRNLTEDQKSGAIIANTVESHYRPTIGEIISEYYIYLVIVVAIIVAAFMIIYINNKFKMNKRLKAIAYYDMLTGARSVEKFRIDANAILDKHKQSKFVLFYMDIDHFKYINDSFGYSIGNDLLCHIARCAEKTLSSNEVFARLSADNFIFMINGDDEQHIQDVICQLDKEIQTFSPMQEASHVVTVSVGIYRLISPNEELYTVLDKANTARKSVKDKHESAYAYYDENMYKQMADEIEIVETMQHALDEREFVLYLQPKCHLSDNSISGAEALVRWRHHDKGIISPDKFIPLFEKNGFITKIDFFIFEEVCHALRYMIDEGYDVYPVSINLSRVHMKSREFIETLTAIAEKHCIPLSLLELELTETVILQNIDELLIIMNTLKDIGFILSMDDFGTGYSSLNLLKELPVDVLKIDRSFFNENEATEREKTIMRDIVAMAHHLDMKVVSEGVETQRQRDLLTEINCDMAQGYLFARPMPIEEFLEFIDAHK